MDIKFFNFLTKKSIDSDKNFFVLIDNKTFIIELLNQILKSRKSIKVFVGSHKKIFKTFLSFIEIDKTPYITTEYISFLNLYKSKFESEDIVFVFKNQDTYYGFKTSFLDFINKNQLKVELPYKIYKLQRREFVRVKQSIRMPIQVRIAPYYKDNFKALFKDFVDFWEAEKLTISPSIVDISEGGVSMVIHTDANNIDTYKFPIFRIKLSILKSEISVIARLASILVLSHKDKKNRYRLGFSFRNITNNDRSIIKEYIMERQSEILKNRKRNI